MTVETPSAPAPKRKPKKIVPQTSTISGDAIAKLDADLRAAAARLSPREARYLVDLYYQMQDNRIRCQGQVRAMLGSEPCAVIDWALAQSESLESRIKSALDKWSDSTVAGRWAKSQYGIGPVLAAGLLAYIDISKAPHVGHIYSFGGVSGTNIGKWNKGEKRPWCAALKVLIWKVGKSFAMFHNRDECYYGHVYAAHKAKLIERNEQGEFVDAAKASLDHYKFGKNTEAYAHCSAGRLRPANIEDRSIRYAAKLFLSHLHFVMYEQTYGAPPAPYYASAFLGHDEFIYPPGYEGIVPADVVKAHHRKAAIEARGRSMQ